MLQKRLRLFRFALLASCCACTTTSTPIEPIAVTAESWEAASESIVETARSHDFDRALLLLEEIECDWADDYRWQFLYSHYSLSLFESGLRNGGLDASVMDGLLADCVGAAQLSLSKTELLQTRIILTKALRFAGRTAEAIAESRPLQFFLKLAPIAEPQSDWLKVQDEMTDSMRVSTLHELGQIALAASAEAVRANQPMPRFCLDAVLWLKGAVREMHANGLPHSPDVVIALADLHAWAGRIQPAREVFIAALISKPATTSYYERLTRLGAQDPIATGKALERVRLAHPTDALVLWHTGEARYYEARTRRSAADFRRAFEALARAEECFHQAIAQNPAYEASCRTWLHIVRTQRGWCWREDGELDKAAEAFLTALAADENQLEAESTAETLRLGIDAIVWDYFTADGGDDRHPSLKRLDDGKAFLERVLALHQQNPSWFNNLGFACRDLGTTAEAAGRVEDARDYFEQSWVAYGDCVALAPNDVRLINDRALIAVYYLGREWVTAESELYRAISLGERQMAEMADDASAESRQLLDEAIGDAWENLAYHNLHNLKQLGPVDGFLLKSVRHYPFERRDGVARMRAILKDLSTP